MSIQRTEVPNNTDEQVREYIEKAMALADDLAREPAEWRHIFTQACTLYQGKQILMSETPTIGLGQILGNGKGR